MTQVVTFHALLNTTRPNPGGSEDTSTVHAVLKWLVILT